jgi:hypothetical protein
MNRTSRILVGVAVVAVAGAAVVYVSRDLRRKQEVADQTADQIEAQIAALDPVTRAAVVARLSTDAAKTVHDRAGH